jgi:hypothetical protein
MARVINKIVTIYIYVVIYYVYVLNVCIEYQNDF